MPREVEIRRYRGRQRHLINSLRKHLKQLSDGNARPNPIIEVAGDLAALGVLQGRIEAAWGEKVTIVVR